jgi:hypothetical protein
MDEYISRAGIIAEYDRQHQGPPGGARKIMETFPAADVRPVVLCRDCKYWDRERISCEGLARCNTGESGIRYRNRNDFCSRGEKRDES